MATQYFSLTDLSPQPASAEVYYNLMQRFFEALSMHNVRSATTTAQPGSPTNEDVYVLPAAPTGTNWTGNGLKLAFFLNGTWYFYTLGSTWEGITFIVQDEDCHIYWNGSAWTYVVPRSATTVTPSATHTQGGAAPMLKRITFVISASANDALLLLPASVGIEQIVVNTTAQALQVYPASGDDIDGGAANANIVIAAAKTTTFRARDGTHWHSAVSG